MSSTCVIGGGLTGWSVPGGHQSGREITLLEASENTGGAYNREERKDICSIRANTLSLRKGSFQAA